MLALVCVSVVYLLHTHRRTTILVPEPSDSVGVTAHGPVEEEAEQEKGDLEVRRTVSAARLELQDTFHHEDQIMDPEETAIAVKESRAPVDQADTETPEISKTPETRQGGPTIGPPLQRAHNEQQKAVVAAFKHAWKGYTDYAWGHDELLPMSRRGANSFGMGLTIIDSLDTIWLMGLSEEFEKARQWVANRMNIVGNRNSVSVFETTIRVLGGLLSAYHLSNDKIFLQRAVSCSSYMYPSLSPTPSPLSPLCLSHLPSSRSCSNSVLFLSSSFLPPPFQFPYLSHLPPSLPR